MTKYPAIFSPLKVGAHTLKIDLFLMALRQV